MVHPRRIIVRTLGGPEVMEVEEFDPGQPGDGEVLVEQEAIGLNFIDTYYRSGLYPADLPLTPGVESVGRIIAMGSNVPNLSVGDYVGAASGLGGYATHRIMSAAKLVKIPDSIPAELAAAGMLKGMTACFLAEDILPLSPGQVAVVHAAAGGVGSILVPWLRDMGVTVIAHCGSAEKAAKVPADHSLSGSYDDLTVAVRDLTGGRGADVVYDGIGKDSWSASIACLKKRGMMVSYGNASGAVPPITLLELSRAGSLFVTRPTLFDYASTPEELAHTSARLFDRLKRGVVKIHIGQHFALTEAVEAHRALEARRTTGSTILLP